MTATLTTLASFPTAGFSPLPGGLVADAHGDLFGVTFSGPAYGGGTVFEIPHTAAGYGSPITLVSFNGTNGSGPNPELMLDAHGNLFGTTAGGGNGYGTVYEIVHTHAGYANTPTTLVNFDYSNGAYPAAGLIADHQGNLFGTTQSGGQYGFGTVFELAPTASGYSSPVTLVSFDNVHGGQPTGGLISDAHGNLFGTTPNGGANGYGTVFELVQSASGYALTTLVNFNGNNGSNPAGNLILDNHGNLFGTTAHGGANDAGTVFEIANNANGYARNPTTLASFSGPDGYVPLGGLIADHQGNLFGTTIYGGANNVGTVFEIANTATGYASTPIALVSFDGNNGGYPGANLIADPQGDLFGTTSGGYPSVFNGTVFELAGVFGPNAVAYETNILGASSSEFWSF